MIFLVCAGIVYYRITTSNIFQIKPETKNVLLKNNVPKPQLNTLTEQKNVLEHSEEIKNPLHTSENKESYPNIQTQSNTTLLSPNKMEQTTPPVRNIKFVFFSSKAKKVSVIGDFNDWLPQSLIKVAPNKWEITLKITPGKNYLYNFLVDGKVVLDPNNKKPPQISPQGFKSSVLSL